ncbi:MAG: sugar kinase [Chitinispirillales bacterium]|jgi:2-dehydro-3-deoxygluconokinase|nr:sugar kinase [Chitinispirillales bacterium]
MISVHNKEYDLLVIGESMVEFTCDEDVVNAGSFKMDIGGADIVVAAAAARLGSKVRLISAIAHDQFHGFIRERLTAQKIDISLVTTCQQSYNGIYITSTRYPEYREYLIHHPGTASKHIIPTLVNQEYLENSKIVYASSELQSVSPQTQRTVFNAFLFAHTNKIMVAYDPNLRLQRWSFEEARMSLWGVLPLVDVFFVSWPEESKALFGYERPLDVIGFLLNRNVGTVVVKMGADGCIVGTERSIKPFPQPACGDGISPFKTPALAGSAFNGAFLNCIANGYDPFAAAEFANSVALFKGIKGWGIDSLPTVNDLCRAS